MEIIFFGKDCKKMQSIIKDAHEKAIKLWNQKNERQFKTTILHIKLCTRMRSNGGTAYGKKNLIKINYRLFKDNLDHLEQTYVHELAHIIQRKVYGYEGVSSHGIQWKYVMKCMNKDPRRCHVLDTSHLKAKRRKWLYKCDCRTFKFGSGRHNKSKRGSLYKCTLCNAHFVYVSKKEAPEWKL